MVVSIQPIHSLVAGVMKDVAMPGLLIRGVASPHDYQLRPSEARRLAEADLIFWVGESLETFLSRPLSRITGNVVEILEIKGLTLHPARPGGIWKVSDHDSDGHDDNHAHGVLDPHLWLDTGNAKRIVQSAANRLVRLDSARSDRYRHNEQTILDRLDTLDAELRQTFADVQATPYMVFHDAFQYLERRYGLSALGAMVAGVQQTPGARRLRDLRTVIMQKGAHCIAREPQFAPAWIATLTEGTDVNEAILDPLGAGLESGPDAYFAMMRANADAIVACLGG